MSGILCKDLIGRTVGELNHARWLTLGSRIICAYMKTTKPKRELRILAEFVLKGYGNAWLQARLKPRATDAPRIYHGWLLSMQTFPKDIRDAIEPILANGTYWAHSENLLLSALSDSDPTIRAKAVSQILRIRNDGSMKERVKKEEQNLKQKKKCTYKRQRIFWKPEVNYQAPSYIEMIDWDSQAFYEPPLTKRLSDESVQDFIMSPLELEVVANSVQTERTIQTVAQITATSTEPSIREGHTRSVLKDYKSKPSLETKADLLG